MQITPDLFNGVYEGVGAVMLALNTRRLYVDKQVKGVSVVPLAFFGSWGLWNLYYYPALGQWLSFTGGAALVTVNLLNLALMMYYIRNPGGPNGTDII
jgi:hypothetical protein